MSSTRPENVVGAHAGNPSGRTLRVLSDRQTYRRDNLIKELGDPASLAENVETLTAQARGIREAFKPRNAWQDWLTSTIATHMIRLSRCERIERKLRDLASYRAIEFWEEDQALEVENLAMKIAKHPDRVVARLRQTPAGCDWLLKRWRFLADVDPQTWTEAQKTLAGQMVGGDSQLDPTAPGFADAQVVHLESQRGAIEKADAIVRGLVEADLNDDMVPGLAKLRRYSNALMRQMKWTIDQFHVEHPDRRDEPIPQPGNLGCEVERRINETKPFSHDSSLQTRTDETKPILPDGPPRIDETKPFVRVGLIASLADALPETSRGKEVITRDHDINRAEQPRREARLIPADEAARRQKAARRREALACGVGV